TLPSMAGTISGFNESIQCSSVNMTNCGIMTTGNGIIIVASSIKNKKFLPGKRIFEKAKAAKEEVNVPMVMTGTATVRLFRIPLRNGAFSQISVYFTKFGFGNQSGGIMNASTGDFIVVMNIHQNGIRIKNAPMPRSR